MNILRPKHESVLKFTMLFSLLVSGTPATAEDFTGRDFSGQDLRSRDFKDAVLKDAKMGGANLTDVRLSNADLRGADLRLAHLNKADATGADFRDAKLEDANFTDAKLDKANLEGQTLYLAGSAKYYDAISKSGVYGIQISSKNGALSFMEANLRRTKIHGNVESIDFRRADLRGADLSEATNMDQALFKGAIYDRRTIWKIDPVAKKAILKEDATSGLVGSWVITVEAGGAASLGLLDVNDDKTYRWLISEKVPSVRGKWHATTPSEEKQLGLAGLVLEKGEEDLDWGVTPKAATDTGREQISLRSLTNDKVRSAKRQVSP